MIVLQRKVPWWPWAAGVTRCCGGGAPGDCSAST